MSASAPARSLALAIPTYQRADILEENLLAMRAELERLDIPVHILDDSHDDATAALVARLGAGTGIRLRYQHNRPALRHDANLIAALAAPGTDFVWLLGDGCIIRPGGLQAVHEAVQQDPDFAFVHAREGPAPRSQDILRAELARRFLVERTWDFTLTGATIYSRRVIDWWRADPGHRPYANFPHLSVILAYSASHPTLSVAWMGQRLVGNHPRKTKSYWLADAIPVWAGDWHRVVTANAAAFDAADLPGVLRSHSRHTRVLGLKHLLVLRASGRLDGPVLARFGSELGASSSAGPLGVRAIATLPRSLAAAIVRTRPRWRRRYLPADEAGPSKA